MAKSKKHRASTRHQRGQDAARHVAAERFRRLAEDEDGRAHLARAVRAFLRLDRWKRSAKDTQEH